MNPEDFLSLAKSLLAGDDAVRCRCAIGRAYYAAHNVAVQTLRANQCPVHENANSHGEVIKYLRWSNVQELVDAANKIEDLKNKRNIADYQMSSNPKVEKESNALLQITTSGRVISTIKTAFGSPDRDAIVNSIRGNLKKVTGT